MRCIDPRPKDANLWILIWVEVHRVHQEDKLVEAEHVKARRSKKATRKQMSWHCGTIVKNLDQSQKRNGLL